MKLAFTMCLLFSANVLFAQININFNVNTSEERLPISPYIYGTNEYIPTPGLNISAIRQGGNRLTGYNWENNYSHAGTDYNNQSDQYLPWIMNLPFDEYLKPNKVIKTFHKSALANNCLSIVTLPMAGYVSADGNGEVTEEEKAPSKRWKQVINQKGKPFSLNPDTTDGFIYVDECLNNLINEFGLSSTNSGIKAYSMDNEYALWNSTHPRIHPDQPTIGEVLLKSKNLAQTIKKMDPDALVFGPADYGFYSYYMFQGAPDWSTYSSFGTFIGAYLNYMKQVSDSVGNRMLDVLDMHWYPEAQGYNDQGQLERIVAGSNDRGVAEARMQSPRSLWDTTYIEKSWISEYFGSIDYIHKLQKAIDTYFPNTKLAFTEYLYGGKDHISGGIALADVLGIFGNHGIFAGLIWDSPIEQYYASAFKIFRNYDGNNSKFGDIHIKSSSNDYRASSVYASLNSNDTNELHIIVINKNYDSALVSNFNINSKTNFENGVIYCFNEKSQIITKVGNISNISKNNFSYTIPPLSVYHFILKTNPNSVESNADLANNMKIIPNPARDYIEIDLGAFNPMLKRGVDEYYDIQIFDMLGVLVLTVEQTPPSVQRIDISNLSLGMYFIRIGNRVEKFVKM